MPKLSKLDQARLELFARIPHCAPDFMVEPWQQRGEESSITTQSCNNAYAYAANDPEMQRTEKYPVMPVPGMGRIRSGIKRGFDDKNIRKMAVSEGLIYAGKKKPRIKPGTYIVACSYKTETCSDKTGKYSIDRFHFSRLDRNGVWSEKYERDLPICLIANIPHVQCASHHAYRQFVGYFYAPNSGIILGRRDQVFKNPTSTEAARRTPFRQPDLIQAKIARDRRQRIMA